MNYRIIVGALCLSATIVAAEEQQSGIAGLPGPVFAQADPRDCVSPECGGYFLRDSAEDACSTSYLISPDRYVTRIVVRGENGTLTPVYPSCSDFLRGMLEADPEAPNLRMYVLCIECD